MATDLELVEDYPPHKAVSPTGRYALAWGIPGVTGISKMVDNNQSDQLDTEKAHDYLVERRTMSIIGTLPIHTRRCRWYGSVGNYKSGGNYTRASNNSNMAAFWSRAEDWVLISHHGKWWYEALYLGHYTEQGFHFIEVGDQVEDAVRAELRRRHTRLYDQTHQVDGRDPAVDLSNAHLRPSVLAIEVAGGVPKDDSNPLNFRGKVEMRFTDRAHNIHAEIINLHLKPSGNGYW